ncbi:MAG: 30S ribosomal protein S8 [Candidatus Komeilibacteria bacterium]|nr:30S ribosomal protein S8 [Candidatus Komeilibacteria bacterium]
MMTDPISDMLTRIRNAQAAHHEQTAMPFSKLKQKIAALLVREKYLSGLSESEVAGKKVLIVDLQYSPSGEGAISDVKRISKPGRRVYQKKNELPKVLSGYGIAVVSTPEGLMTNKEAMRHGLGGEIICEIY